MWGSAFSACKARLAALACRAQKEVLPAVSRMRERRSSRSCTEKALPHPDLTNNSRGEDSAPTFFGDTFQTTGKRYAFFGTNRSGDAGLSAANGVVSWRGHLSSAASSGVMMTLFGAGVGGSTTNVGSPSTDAYWWITKAQSYYQHPVPLP